MTPEERLAWVKKEAFIRAHQPYDPVKERRREQEVGATSNEVGRAVRKYLRGEEK